MKKLIAFLLVFVLVLSYVNLVPFNIGKVQKEVVEASSTNSESYTTHHAMGCIPSPVKAWPRINASKLEQDLLAKGISPTALPASVDLSTGLPPVGDQKWQGSCAAWATGYYYKTFQEGKEQGWNLSFPNHQFSPAFIYNQINGGSDNGSTISNALNLLVNKGCDTLAVFPYNPDDYTTQPTASQLQLALPFKAKSYANIFQGQGNCTDTTITTLKQWLANGDMFVIAIPVYPEFDPAPSDPSYVIPPHNPSDKPIDYHALAVVGYNDNLYYTDASNVKHYGAFKIVNSWGTSYGYGGFVNLSYDFFKVDVVEAWTMVDDTTPQGFTLGVFPLKQEVMPGGSATFTIMVDKLSGFTGNVSLSVSNLPSGVSYTLSQSSVTPPANVTLTLNVSSSVTSSTYPFTISATSGSTTYTLNASLVVIGSSGLLIHVKNQLGNPAVNTYIVVLDSNNNWRGYGYTDDTGSLYLSNISSGTYKIFVFSESDHFGLIKSNITAPGEYTFDTTNTQHITVNTKKKDGSALEGYIWMVDPSSKNRLKLGFTDGSISCDITPGTYTAMITSLSSYYLLTLPNITIDSNTTQVTLDASTMQTGSITFTQHGFDRAYVYAWGSYCYWTYGFEFTSQKTIIFSADTYDLSLDGFIYPQDGSSWGYWFDVGYSTVSNNSNLTIDFGGNLSISTQPSKTFYYQGEQVSLSNKVSDAYGNRLTGIYEYLRTSSVNFSAPLMEGEVVPGFSASFGPLVKVIGPDSNVYYQSSDISNFSSTYFTASSNWPLGTYTVNISLYTGPYQGTVKGTNSFNVVNYIKITSPTGSEVFSPTDTITVS
ncbi:C1 family peptidase, partial [Caldisericum sp. AR60]|uniref:C1 family peptidase n=1 Tax=Caldisericum sp. AR60 TaxID=3397852 RepID=UPI0039FDCD3E